jgi:hypothetical protein
MFRIDHSTAAASLAAPGAAGTPGYFTEGNPGTGTAATVVTADWANMIQEELMAIISAAGLTPDKTNRAQLLAALPLATRGRVISHLRHTFTSYFQVSSAMTTWTDITGFSQAITNAAGNAAVRAQARISAHLVNSVNSTYFRLLVNGGEYTDSVLDTCHLDGIGANDISVQALLSADVDFAQNTIYTFRIQGKSAAAGSPDCRVNASQDYPTAADPDASSFLSLMAWTR